MLKRAVYQRPQKAPLRPMEDCRGVYASSGVVVAMPKAVIHRSEAYRRYVTSHECFGCSIAGLSQCAHENFDKGMAMKVCDSRTFPLCADRFGMLGCHSQFDLGIDVSRADRRELGRKYVARMQSIAIADGWRFDPKGIHKP